MGVIRKWESSGIGSYPEMGVIRQWESSTIEIIWQ